MAENKRTSLVDDSYQSVGAKKAPGKSSSGGSGATVKIALAIGCMVIAGILIAFQMGFIPNPFEEKIKPTVRTQEESKAVQDYQKQVETNKTKPNVQSGGS
jgi:hypothetical protein